MQTLKKPARLILLTIVSLSTYLLSAIAAADYQLNFQEPVTGVARDIYGLHMEIFWICVAIFVAVFSVMFYSIFKHRRSKNYQPSQFSHSTQVEIIWTIIPFFILVYMAWPATKVLINMEDTTKSDLTIKITGYQWKWGYEYLDSDISFYSTLSTPREQIDQFDRSSAVKPGENYLLEVDNHLVVPSGKKVRALITANDVIHAWWIPAFGTKKDAIPGYINELWFNVDPGKEGIYRGQCAELCGKDHAFMPIVVEVVAADEFDAWLAADGSFKQIKQPITTSSDSNRLVEQVKTVTVSAQTKPQAVEQKTDLSLEQLMIRGEKVSQTCSACHGTDGKGVPGVFPAIAGSAIATSDIDAHINIVMFGKAGTAMQAFAGQLSDEDLAAVITYQRNAYGNDTGDVVLPADIRSRRK